ncbi:head maturation protease, ClpP-related [Belliella pelovolcani]|uniref:head maturation protease, ClpP-related n=1 Tax=Belliella pelovolcani TaxID=529505 RepID=UPI00391BF5D9
MTKNTAKFYEIFNQSDDDSSVDIFIYGVIPHLDWDTYELKNDAEKFVKDFKKLEKDYDRINIHINSPGGSLYHAFPIFNVIANSKKEIHTYNDGLSASAGGVLLLAGKKIHSAKNAFLMIHRASGAAWGDAGHLRQYAETLEKYEGVVADHFAKVTGKTKEYILENYFNGKDYFLTADEALEEGFIHVIEDYESEDAPPSDIKNMAFSEVMNLYRKEEKPESFIGKITNHIRKTFNLNDANTDAPQNTTPKADPPAPIETPTITNTDMNFETSINLLSKDTVSAEDITAIKAEIEAYRNAGEKLTADEVTAKVDEAIAPLNSQIENLTAEKTQLATEIDTVKAAKTQKEEEITNLTNTITDLNNTVEAYRKTGVQIDNAGSDNPDDMGEGASEAFLSQADVDAREARRKAGITE